MENAIASNLTPEEYELKKKQKELATVEAELAERELDLATLEIELQDFEKEYFRVVGIKYTKLDAIEAKIAEYMTSLESNKNWNPSKNLKKLYREVAKSLHPDLATDEKERQRRQQLMVLANLAYEEGNEEKLKEILEEWQSSPEAVAGEGTVAELIRTIRKISQSQERIQAITQEIEKLETSDLFELKNKVSMAQDLGRDLLQEMATILDRHIADATEKLNELKSKLGIQ